MTSSGALRRMGARLAAGSPALPRRGTALRAGFSTTAQRCRRRTRDSNKARGVSSLYGSGPREHLSVSDMPLPRPRDLEPKMPVDESHGLWGFFPAPGKAVWTPKETEEHGRAWTVEELRKKSWEDLHSLWWVCCRERNMLATSKVESEKGEFGFGEKEIEARDEEVMKTMRAIKHALTERYYTWLDAVDVAELDPEIDLHAKDGQVYKPGAYEEEELAAASCGGRDGGQGRQETRSVMDKGDEGLDAAAGLRVSPTSR